MQSPPDNSGPLQRDYRLLLLTADLAAAVGVLAVVMAADRGQGLLTASYFALLLLPLCWCGALFLGGAYTLRPDRPWPVLTYQVLRGLLTGTIAAGGLAALLPFLHALPPERYLSAAGLMLPVAVALRLAALRWLPREMLTERYLVLAGGENTRLFWASLTGVPLPAHVQIVGAVTADGQSSLPGPGLPCLGSTSELAEVVRAHHVHALVVVAPTLAADEVRAVLKCEEGGVRVVSAFQAHEELTRRTPLFEHNGAGGAGLVAPRHSKYATRLKRAVDLAVALLLLPLSVVLLGLAALAVLLDDGAPVFYRQERVGRDGRHFRLLKVRTMFRDAEADTGPIWAAQHDPRVTRVGRWLRTLHLDELPQLFNILRGDMSLVGPRPERPAFVEDFSRQIPYYEQRLLVRPGLTGWAQVNRRSDRDLEDVLEKLRHDLYYLRHLSFSLDLQILLATLGVVLSRPRAR